MADQVADTVPVKNVSNSNDFVSDVLLPIEEATPHDAPTKSDSEERSSKRSKSSSDAEIEKESVPGAEIPPDVKLIKVIVKSPKDENTIEIKESAIIKELKEEVSKVFKSPADDITLIFSGQLLKDEDVLSASSIKDGTTVHFILKTPKRPSADLNASPFGLGAFEGLPGLGNLCFGSQNFLQVQQQMQKELEQNPNLLQQVIGNPFVKSMMESPDYMRQIINSNPQMQEMLNKNPELDHMLNNPDVLRNTVEIARNPAMLQELIQSNIENMPSQSDVPEAEKNDKSNDKSNNTEAPKDDEKQPAPKEDEKEPAPKEDETKPAPKKVEEESKPPPAAEAGSQVFSSPYLQSIMQQLGENPQLVQEMYNAPYMSTMMEALAANPEVANQVLVNNPVFGNNLNMQEQMRRNLPTFMRQLRNPEMQKFVSNPRAVTAMMNIQQGLDQLQQLSPGVFNTFQDFPPPPPYLPQTVEVPPTEMVQDDFSNFMKNMVKNMAHENKSSDAPPEEKYRCQLKQMELMGFYDNQANVQDFASCVGV